MPRHTAKELGRRFAHHPAAMGVNWSRLWEIFFSGENPRRLYECLDSPSAWRRLFSRIYDYLDSPLAWRRLFNLAYPEHEHDLNRAIRFWSEVVGVHVEILDTFFLFNFLVAAIAEWSKLHGRPSDRIEDAK